MILAPSGVTSWSVICDSVTKSEECSGSVVVLEGKGCKGCWSETQQRHCMNKTLYPLSSTGLTQEDKKTS